MKPEEIIEVVQAHIDGKVVQYKHLGVWKKTAFEPKCWDFEDMEYRIKPEPREFYIRKTDIEINAYTLDCYSNKACDGDKDLYIKVVEVCDE